MLAAPPTIASPRSPSFVRRSSEGASSELPRRRASLSRLVSWSTATLLLVPGALIVMLALVILVYENANATKGYRLRTLERERKQLLLQQETLNMQIAEAQALQSLVGDPQVLGMERMTKPTFIVPVSAVARRSHP